MWPFLSYGQCVVQSYPDKELECTSTLADTSLIDRTHNFKIWSKVHSSGHTSWAWLQDQVYGSLPIRVHQTSKGREERGEGRGRRGRRGEGRGVKMSVGN